jgi:hypothetical protein
LLSLSSPSGLSGTGAPATGLPAAGRWPDTPSEVSRNPFAVLDRVDDRIDDPIHCPIYNRIDFTNTLRTSGRMDAAGSSGPNAAGLQVGYQDASLGYVELRAHSDGGGIHASLEVQSAAAGDTLTGHLTALAGWMNERHTPVESLTVATAASPAGPAPSQHGRGSTDGGSSPGTQTGNAPGGGHDTQNPHSGGESRAVSSAVFAPAGISQEWPEGREPLSVLPAGSSFSAVA